MIMDVMDRRSLAQLAQQLSPTFDMEYIGFGSQGGIGGGGGADGDLNTPTAVSSVDNFNFSKDNLLYGETCMLLYQQFKTFVTPSFKTVILNMRLLC